MAKSVFIPVRIIVLFLALVALAACRADDVDLAAFNCQLDDIPATIPYAAATPITTPPAPEQFGEAVSLYHRADFTEQSLANHAIRCEMMQFADDAAAVRAFTTACNQNLALEVEASTCSFGEGVETVVFQQVNFLVLVTADLNGMYGRELADAVAERLERLR